jgi:hypothetical protein
MFDGGEGFRLNFTQDKFEEFDGAFVRVVMDNDGIPEGFVDLLEVKNEIREEIDSRKGGPWVIDPNDTTPVSPAPGLKKSTLIPKVSQPNVVSSHKSGKKPSYTTSNAKHSNYNVSTPNRSVHSPSKTSSRQSGVKRVPARVNTNLSKTSRSTRSKKSSVHNSIKSSQKSSRRPSQLKTSQTTDFYNSATKSRTSTKKL